MKATKYTLAIALGLIALVAPRTVRADSILFDASGTFANGAVLTGTVTIDTTLGKVTASSLATTNPTDGPFSFLLGQGLNSSNFYFFEASTSSGHQIFLYLPTDSLTGYAGGAFCTLNLLNCTGPSGITTSGLANTFLTTGSLTPTSIIPTPEPSSLLLLGTGLLGLMAMGLYKKGLA